MAELEADELVGGPAVADEAADAKVEPTEAAATEAAPEPDEVSVVIEGESPSPEEEAERAPEWVRDLRKRHAEQARLLREREQEIERLKSSPKPEVLPVGEKPTLESCAWDAEKLERELDSWHARKRESEDKQRQEQQQAEAANKAWQEKLQSYATERTALKVPDYEEAENLVLGTLSTAQQSVIVSYFPNRATLVYAIGKNPKTAQRLAAISDPIEFALAVGELARKVQVTPKKSPPPPEPKVKTTGSVSPTDSTLEKLRAEAAKTGNFTKVAEYKRSLRQK